MSDDVCSYCGQPLGELTHFHEVTITPGCPTCGGKGYAPEPNAYKLLHFAAQLARQLEAAQMPETHWRADVTEPPNKWCIMWTWPMADIVLYPDGECVAQWTPKGDVLDANATFRVGDPLPPTLIAAMRETA